MDEFKIIPPPHFAKFGEVMELINTGKISRYTAPRPVVLKDGSNLLFYPFVGTTEDARPVWDF